MTEKEDMRKLIDRLSGEKDRKFKPSDKLMEEWSNDFAEHARLNRPN